MHAWILMHLQIYIYIYIYIQIDIIQQYYVYKYNIKQRMFAKKNTTINENKLKQKQHIYSLHYSPKLTAMILADSDISHKESSSSQASSRISIPKEYKQRQKQALMGRHDGNQMYRKQWMDKQTDKNKSKNKNKSKSKVQAKYGNSMAMKIRFSVQSFLIAVGCEQQMSSKLQFAIQNLLLSILNIANTLDEQEGQQQTGIEQQHKESRVSYMQDGHINEENEYRQSSHSDVVNVISPISSMPSSTNRNNHIKIEESDELPVLCECPAEEDSSSLSGSVPISDRDGQQYEQYREIMSRFNHMNSNTSNLDIIKSNTYTNSNGNKVNNNNSYLQTYTSRCNNSQPHRTDTHTMDNIRQSQHEQQQHEQSQQMTQSEIQIQQQSHIKQKLPSYYTRSSNNYMSNYNCVRDLTRQFNQCHVNTINNNKDNRRKHQYKQDSKEEETDQVQYSISQYYIEDSQLPEKENKQPLVNVTQFQIPDKSKHNSRKEDGQLYSHVLSRRKIF